MVCHGGFRRRRSREWNRKIKLLPQRSSWSRDLGQRKICMWGISSERSILMEWYCREQSFPIVVFINASFAMQGWSDVFSWILSLKNVISPIAWQVFAVYSELFLQAAKCWALTGLTGCSAIPVFRIRWQDTVISPIANLKILAFLNAT